MKKTWVDPKYKFLGNRASKQYPELNNISLEDAAKFIQEKAYKGLPELRSSLGLGNAITKDTEYLNRIGAHASSTSKGITIDPSLSGKDRDEQLGYLMHEYGHQLDDASTGYAKLKAKRKEYEDTPWLPNPLNKIMKYKNIDDATEAAEQMRKNYPSGKMDQFLDSPFAEEYRSGPSDPVKMNKDERDGGHHMNRDFRLDNIERIKKGGLEEVVKSDRFKKLRSLIS
jgi:hypothetical protein